MKILLTGSSGFLGNNLTEHLNKDGHDVVGYDYTDGQDIRDKLQFTEWVTKYNPDICIHLAAIANLNHFDDDIKLGSDINIIGTNNVLDVCEQHNVRVLFASTCCCYGDNKLELKHFKEKE